MTIPDIPFEVNEITKTSAARYHLRFEYDKVNGGGGGWAIFFVDDATGVCSAVTDWGDYAHRWPLSGMRTKENGKEETLTEFLSRIDSGYAFTKFIGEKKHFDLEGTKKEIKRLILERRREILLDSDEARTCFDEINAYSEDYDSNFYRTYFEENCPETFEKVFEGSIGDIPVILKYSSWEEIFVRRIFPTFQKVLKEVLNGKAN